MRAPRDPDAPKPKPRRQRGVRGSELGKALDHCNRISGGALIIAAADLLVVPSLDLPSGRREGLPQVAREAAARALERSLLPADRLEAPAGLGDEEGREQGLGRAGEGEEGAGDDAGRDDRERDAPLAMEVVAAGTKRAVTGEPLASTDPRISAWRIG